MLQITIKYGLTKEITREVQDGTRISTILSDPSNKSILGYPESVSAVVDGVTLSGSDTVNDGDVIILEKQAASKAA